MFVSIVSWAGQLQVKEAIFSRCLWSMPSGDYHLLQAGQDNLEKQATGPKKRLLLLELLIKLKTQPEKLLEPQNLLVLWPG